MLMRERGIGVSIVDVMEDIGLTHGGFYMAMAYAPQGGIDKKRGRCLPGLR
jgi:hypothetical protein